MRGDYNTVNWKPAALIADVASFLSNTWTDANSDDLPSTGTLRRNQRLGRTARRQLRNAVRCARLRRTAAVRWRSRELPALPRELERRWPFNYTGSLVSLFVSRQSSRVWGHTSTAVAPYYNPPNRNWSFETRFQNPMLLPPGTPRLGSVLQISYRSVF